jgi:hypothetical protein
MNIVVKQLCTHVMIKIPLFAHSCFVARKPLMHKVIYSVFTDPIHPAPRPIRKQDRKGVIRAGIHRVSTCVLCKSSVLNAPS